MSCPYRKWITALADLGYRRLEDNERIRKGDFSTSLPYTDEKHRHYYDDRNNMLAGVWGKPVFRISQPQA